MQDNLSWTQHIARIILEKSRESRQRKIILVLPSNRLARQISLDLEAAMQPGEMLFFPESITIDELVYRFSDAVPADSEELCILLYQSYTTVYNQKNLGREIKTYAAFREWGMRLLKDFGQLDSQNVDVKEVLTYSYEEKRIAHLSFDLPQNRQETGAIYSIYVSFYRQLWDIYSDFQQRLRTHKKLYYGRALRNLWNRLEQGDEVFPEQEYYIVAGLNALSRCEENILRNMVQNARAEVYWDADAHYMEDADQEAGLFLRRYKDDPYLGRHLSLEEVGSHLQEPKEITVMESPQNVGQVKWVAEYLETLDENKTTAVILNDESLFLPLMSSLPSKWKPNVSMGGFLNFTSAYAWIKSLLEARDYQEYFIGTDRFSLPIEQWNAIVTNPVFAWIEPEHSKVYENLKKMIQSYSVQVSEREVQGIKELEKLLLQRGSVMDFFRHLLEHIGFVLDTLRALPEVPMMDCEFLFRLRENLRAEYAVYRRFETDVDFEYSGLVQMVREQMQTVELNYKGDPQSKLHIMGMLEARGMNFQQLVLVSVNEGILPSKAKDNSFLLYSVRQHCGIPLDREKIGMQAYYFYRLLQSAQKVGIVYSTYNAQNQVQEKSRFLLQIENELPDSRFIYPPYPYPLKSELQNRNILQMEKEDFLLDRLKSYLSQKNISFSFLSLYLQCPLQFCFRYLLGLQPMPEIEPLQPHVKGSIIHQVLEDFFMGTPVRTTAADCIKKRLGRPLTSEDIEDFEKLCNDYLKKSFLDNLKLSSSELETWLQGENYLFYEQASLRLNSYIRLLAQEIRDTSLEVLHCEFKNMKVPLPLLPDWAPLNFYGIIDRVDEQNHQRRIVDYKTGKVEPAELKVDSVDDFYQVTKQKALQLQLYEYLYKKKYGVETEAVIYSMGALNQGAMKMKGIFVEQSKAERERQFEEFLRTVLLEMLDKDLPFEATEEEKVCQYCDFRDVCKVEGGANA